MEPKYKPLPGTRRKTAPVRIGSVTIGGGHPVAPQSMANCPTTDTAACVRQIRALHEAGCNIVRLTVQGRREAVNLKNIREEAARQGLDGVALVADIHFTPAVAELVVDHVDKVRINPGNYGGPGDNFVRLLDKCTARGVALRIGVNHGSLSPHIVERWGDTPRGMVESAMEYLAVCRQRDFDQVVVSMKSSNVRVMVHAYRMLSARLDAEQMLYPLHLGVTEAGNGAEGRIKSAVGIGALLADGLGDTIRVSLTEPPQNEIPVANAIIDYFRKMEPCNLPQADMLALGHYSPFEYRRRQSRAVGNLGGTNVPILDREKDGAAKAATAAGNVLTLRSDGDNAAIMWRAGILGREASGDERPVVLQKVYNEPSVQSLRIKAACDFGMAFIDGMADGISIENDLPGDPVSQHELDETALMILQAARVRMSRTEFIACPGCGRTLFSLEQTLAAVRVRTSHLKNLKIAVMGCIVNGPGEMADADYGYVGEGAGRVSLYKGRELVMRSIPESQALDALVELIQTCGDWTQPAE